MISIKFCHATIFIIQIVIIVLQVREDEISKLLQGFDKPDILAAGGVTLAGQRYIYLSGTDRIVRAKLGRNGVHCMKTGQGKAFNYAQKKKKKLNNLTNCEINCIARNGSCFQFEPN